MHVEIGGKPSGAELSVQLTEQLPEQCSETPYGRELEATSTELNLTGYENSSNCMQITWGSC